MDTLLLVIIVLAGFALLIGFLFMKKKRKVQVQPFPDNYRDILNDIVFYKALSNENKIAFENRMMHFLATTTITGVKTAVDDSDKVYIAASAIIPIFGFTEWEYSNLNEILLYPDSFSHDFQQTGNDRSILGMVGDGAMNNTMILSRHELQQGFINKTGKTNTAIHEFVHLVDKTDGSVDGLPEIFVEHQYALPWMKLMHEEIKKIMSNRSDINPYGATNDGEFLAVAAEYFFERPDLFKSKHPELYEMLSHIFKQQPVIVK